MCIGISLRGSEKEIKQKRSRKDIRRITDKVDRQK